MANAQISPDKNKEMKPEGRTKSTGSVPREEFLKPKKPGVRDSSNQVSPKMGDSLKTRQSINLKGFTLNISDSTAIMVSDSFRFNVDTAATFFGGTYAQAAFIAEYFTYPERCRESGIESYATLLLGISKEGQLITIKVLDYDPLCPEFLNELMNTYKQPHRWNPAKLNGKPVASWLRMPMDFR